MLFRFFRCNWSLVGGKVINPVNDRLGSEAFPMILSSFYTEKSANNGTPQDPTCVVVVEADAALPGFAPSVAEISEQAALALVSTRHPSNRNVDFRERSPPKRGGTFTDTFTDSNGTLLQDHTPSGGTGWTKNAGGTSDITIESNELQSDGASKTEYLCDDSGSADQFVQSKLVTLANFGDCFTALRFVDIDNLIGWRIPGTGGAGMRMSKNVADSITDLVSIQGVAGSVYKVEGDGSTLKFFEDDVQQGSNQTVTDHQTETSAGLRSRLNIGSGWIDDFENASLASGTLMWHRRGMTGSMKDLTGGMS